MEDMGFPYGTAGRTVSPVGPDEDTVCVLHGCVNSSAQASTLLVRCMEGNLFWLLSSIPGRRRQALHACPLSMRVRWREEEKLGETEARRQCGEASG